MAPPEVGIWRELVSVILPCGESVGACASWNWPDAFAGVATSDMTAIRQVAQGGAYRADAQSPDWFGYQVAKHLGWNSNDEAVKARIKVLLKTWFKTGALAKEKRNVEGQRKEKEFVVAGSFANGNSTEDDFATDEL